MYGILTSRNLLSPLILSLIILLLGDGSATTVISHARYVPFFPNVTAGMYTAVDIIKEITPAAKMIIAIREPAERYKMSLVF